MMSVKLMNLAALVPLLLYSAGDAAMAQSLSIVQNYTGNSFFNGWDFYSGVDVNTTGNVFYVGQDVATSQQLAFVNSAGNVILKVDNTTSGVGNSTFGRNSIRISTSGTFYIGSLVIMDAVHMPFGCSVWPAFWSQGPNWPNGGEIDIVENVNMATNNQYALHTLDGCTHPDATTSTGIESGTVVSTDCFNQTNGDEGCLVKDSSSNSYGQGFASNGGGVFATLWDDEGIRIWFFPRGSIPSDVPTSSPNPSGWGTPTAFYPQSDCNMQQFFAPQTLIFDTTICGNFAGEPSVFTATCSGNCLDLVPIPSNYDNAYFELSYVRVFSNGSSGTTTATASSSGSSTTTTTSAGSSGSSGSNTNTNDASSTTRAFLTIMTAILLPTVIALLTSL